MIFAELPSKTHQRKLKPALKEIIVYLFVMTGLLCHAQKEKFLVARYSFNEGKPIDDLGKHNPKVYGAILAPDRFGNSNMAYQLQGYNTSFINLGTSNELKPKAATFSLWFKMDFPIASGRGIEVNPILFTRCCPDTDFNDAFNIIYRLDKEDISVANTFSKEKQLAINAPEKLTMRTWHHVVMCYDDKILGLYLDGKEVQMLSKNFPAKFLEGDSILVGYRMKDKNERFFVGSVDDIEIYDRILSEAEIKELYNAPNPNSNAIALKWILISLMAAALVVLFILLTIRHFRRLVKKEKEKNLAELTALEQEIKILKAQMNPHFIFNSLNTILQFIIVKENEKAELYLTKFSKLIRKLIESNANEFISLDDEIDILKKYLEIEGLRFDQAIETHIGIDEAIDVHNTFIPHMMVQPFVENAVWHGLLLKEGPRALRISFTRIGDNTLFCSVDDNGVGRKKNKGFSTNRSLAIGFIRHRLELLSKKYHEQYKLELIDKTDEKGLSTGTRVEITMPIIKKKI